MEHIVKRIRRSYLLSQKQFGKLIGVSRQMVSYYEVGRKAPGNKMIMELMRMAHGRNIDCKAEDFFRIE